MKNIIMGVQQVAESLQLGSLVIMPTDTIYGICAPITNAFLLKRIYCIKERPRTKGVVILISNLNHAYDIWDETVSHNDVLLKSMNDWPPKTTIIYKSSKKYKGIACSDGTIGLRLVRNCNALSGIIDSVGPLFATSANLSGRKYINSFQYIYKVFKDFKGVKFVKHNAGSSEPSHIIKISLNGVLTEVRKHGP